MKPTIVLPRRRFLRNAALLGAGSLLGIPGVGAAARDVALRVATAKGDISDFMGDAGADKFPYRVNYANFSGGALALQALASGAIDYAKSSETPPIFVAAKNPPLRIVGLIKGDPSIITLIVPKNSPAKNLGDLKGKKVGYIAATNSHYFLLRLLREQGLALSDITAVNLSPQDGLAAFQSGQLDAWSTWGVFGQLAVSNAGGRIIRNGKNVVSSNLLVLANLKSLDDPATAGAIRDYLLRERTVINWINSHQEQWAERSSQLFGLPKNLLLDPVRQNNGWGHMVPIDDDAVKSHQQVADTFADIGLIERNINVSSLWDRRFNEALLQKN